MSLLLEALKRAEKAKEEAQRRDGGGDARARPAPQPLELAPDPAPAEAKPVVTRSELPDISPSLEILTEDIAPPQSPASPRQRPSPSRPPPAAEKRAAEPDPAPARASARAVFEAKHREPNPRLPFYITMGVLGVAVVGTIGYFWYQLRPPAPLFNPNPPPAAAGPVASAPAAPVSSGPARVPESASAAVPAIPGLPGTAAAAPAPAPAAPAPGTPSAPAEAPAGKAFFRNADQPRTQRPPPQAGARAQASIPRRASAPSVAEREPDATIRIARQPAQVHPRVEAAYAAYQAGNLAAARAAYEDALREEPANRDALLGLAAIDVRSGRLEAAEATYRRLLRADPRDAHAQAGLLSLRAGASDPVAAESRVKNLLAADPQAHVLHFSLGNQFARQGRWPEAQQHFFKAFSADATNADYAYNLAVSLDHMRQPRLALQYYERALALAAARGASFDATLARQRVAQLSTK